MTTFSLDVQIKEVEREVKMRIEVYTRQERLTEKGQSNVRSGSV